MKAVLGVRIAQLTCAAQAGIREERNVLENILPIQKQASVLLNSGRSLN